MKALSTTHTIKIRFNEVDSLGIVWHGHYIAYFEEGRESFGKTFGISYLDVKKNGYAVPIVKTSTEHKLPLKYGDVAIIKTTFKNTRAAKMMFSYVIKNEQNDIVCTGETTQVFTSINDGNMALSNPEFYRNWKQKHDLLDA